MNWYEIIIPVLTGFVGLLVGHMFTQTGKVLDQKRMVYKEFLEICPSPQEAHTDIVFDEAVFQRQIGILTVYATPNVLRFALEYFAQFSESQPNLQGIVEAGHPEFFKVLAGYNRMVWEIGNDVRSSSWFARNRVYKPSFPVEEKQ